jgi:hypothetical protein
METIGQILAGMVGISVRAIYHEDTALNLEDFCWNPCFQKYLVHHQDDKLIQDRVSQETASGPPVRETRPANLPTMVGIVPMS